MRLTELVVDPLDGFEEVEWPEDLGREAGHRAVEQVRQELASLRQELASQRELASQSIEHEADHPPESNPES